VASEQRRVPKLVRKLREQRSRHREHGFIYRGAFVVAGLTIVLGGLAMVVLPGPAVAVIPIGLFLLALEFTWAERLLERAIEQAESAKEKAGETSPLQRILATVAIAAAAGGAVAAALVWDIPLLPV
jgi:uncharacterized protein (TIGR02611 family)